MLQRNLIHHGVTSSQASTGARGTDLSCLIRRLKHRLGTARGTLCCVGTSATMGGEESGDELREYARAIFGEDFPKDAVITEDRLSAAEFFRGETSHCHNCPGRQEAMELAELARQEREEEDITRGVRLWFGDVPELEDPLSGDGRVALGSALKRHSFFKSLMQLMDGRCLQSGAICAELAQTYTVMDSDAGPALLDSMLALISHARVLDALGELRPFLTVQVQLWFRELRRVLASVDAKRVELTLAADLSRGKRERKGHWLPVVNCRDCGETGWAGVTDERGTLAVGNYGAFYNLYFRCDKRIRMAFPRREGDDNVGVMTKYRLCPQCLTLQSERDGAGSCVACGAGTIAVWAPEAPTYTPPKSKPVYRCPFCGGVNSLIFLGLRSATAISAGVSQLYASRFNDDKKLLAFNDNVQDASHRAAFFNARTWLFSLRTAMQQYVCDGGEGQSLADFGDGLNGYWLARMSPEEYIDCFIPHDMAGDRDYETLQLTGHFSGRAGRERVLDNVRHRVAWETLREYGKGSRTGRTLEKYGASMACPDTEAIAAAARAALVRIENEAGVRGFGERGLISAMLSFARHMRLNGAFAVKEYEAFVRADGESYLLTKDFLHVRGKAPWMPIDRVMPLFPALPGADMSAGFEFITERGWYVRRLLRMLDKTALQEPGITQACGILFEELERQGILARMDGGKGAVAYGLNPEKFAVTHDVARLRCDVCGQPIQAQSGQAEYWKNSPCLRDNCRGRYRREERGEDYFARLYQNGELARIHAHEHTGLLQKDERESLEAQFKHGQDEHRPWDANLLSCTPTLEMGIDIGELSTVVLCSIPPAQAQYLQRVGRAGRRDGNALTIAVANARPHDLYFFQEPPEMLASAVEAPGVFLNASAVLERQFVAFCLDNWVCGRLPERAIPLQTDRILATVSRERKQEQYRDQREPRDAFPFNFLEYIRENLKRLLDGFNELFGEDELTDETRARISDFARGTGTDHETLRNRILRAFNELWEERDSLRKDIDKLNRAIRNLKEKPDDASFDREIAELQKEKDGLAAVVRQLSEKNTSNYLSDEELLPNYAFPEAGIILKAILTRKISRQTEGGDARPASNERVSFKYQRSAASAISEFAPDNSFYAGGHKLRIDQVDVATSKPEEWRLCPECNHAAPLSTLHDVAACPRCGCPGWADPGQVHTMLKVRTVYSNDNYDQSRSGDESDDRDAIYYSRQMLVDVDEACDIERGYRTTSDELPFGFEFVRKETLREINFGESDSMGEHLKVAGVEEVRNGFRIYKYCGKVQPRGTSAQPRHSRICRTASQKLKNPIRDCMFLYREFTSEAIRILIPSTSMDVSGVKMESFAAAIMLGLRKRFRNVDHLRYTIMDAPVPDSGYRKQYMVIYDSVPGGTGYLKELMETPQTLMHVFELALRAMESCACTRDPEKDGCYHCLYRYRQSPNINNISRRCAVELPREILSVKDTLTEIDSIASISVNSLFDSELERRFIEAIAGAGSGERPVELIRMPVNGKEGYFLQTGGCRWEIELQVDLDGQKGVQAASLADFVFWPRSKEAKQRPVAVFTDGFEYHRDRAEEDCVKRMAIRENLRWLVWSLTWKDVEAQLQSPRPGVDTDHAAGEGAPAGAVGAWREPLAAEGAERV